MLCLSAFQKNPKSVIGSADQRTKNGASCFSIFTFSIWTVQLQSSVSANWFSYSCSDGKTTLSTFTYIKNFTMTILHRL